MASNNNIQWDDEDSQYERDMVAATIRAEQEVEEERQLMDAAAHASQEARDADDEDQLFMQAAAQGQTVLVASGDDGTQQTVGIGNLSSVTDINYLCSSGYVVCIGGTRLNLQFDGSGNATQYLSETVWNTLGSSGGGASGGGRSRYVAKPAYQSGTGVPSDGLRDVPDVAAVADPGGPGALLVVNGAIDKQTYGGTSLAAPMWAGVIALVNQYSSPGGIGWANPRLYQLGSAQHRSSSAPRVFNDVTAGNNATTRLPPTEARELSPARLVRVGFPEL